MGIPRRMHNMLDTVMTGSCEMIRIMLTLILTIHDNNHMNDAYGVYPG